MKPFLPTVCLLSLALAGSCASSSGVDRAQDTAQAMLEMKQALEDAPDKITAVSASLEQLSKGGVDMKAQFATFTGNVDALVAHRERIRGLRSRVETNKATFTGEWEKRMEEIKSEDIRKRAEERRTAVVKKLEDLAKISDSGREEFEPWMQKVVDVRTYLEHDLNPSGVSSVRDVIRDIGKGAGSVNKKIAAVVSGLDEISKAIAAAKPPEPPAEAKK